MIFSTTAGLPDAIALISAYVRAPLSRSSAAPDRRFSAHHLLDKARLGFQRLPHVRIEGALGHIAVDLHLFVRVALAQYSPFTLLDVARAPWRIEVMKCHKPSLDVGAGAHLFGGPEKYPHSARIHAIKEHLLGGVGLRVMDECNLSRRNARGDELRPDVVVNVESLGIGRGEVAEDELCRAVVPSVVPDFEDSRNRAINLGVLWLAQCLAGRGACPAPLCAPRL